MHNLGNIDALITIVFGLMLTDLFASIHRLIRKRHLVRWHWLPILLAWYVLLVVLKNWYAMVVSEHPEAWSGGWIFLFYGHLLLLLYLMTSAVLPDEIPPEGIDLLEFHFANRRQFWGLLASVNLLLLAFSLVRPLLGRSLILGAVLSNAIMAGISLSLAVNRRFRFHAVLIILLVALLIMELLTKF